MILLLSHPHNRLPLSLTFIVLGLLGVLAVCTEAGYGLRGVWGLKIASVISRLVNTIYVLVSIGLLLGWLPPSEAHTRFGPRLSWLVLCSLADLSLVQGIKKLLWMPRPKDQRPKHWGHSPHSGFPSGHTVPAFMLAYFVSQAHPRLALLWFSLAVIIAWSRVQVRAHFAYQVIVSAFLGCVLGWVLCSCPTSL